MGTRRRTGRRAPIHRTHVARTNTLPELENVWGHGFKFGDTELYIGPPKEAATVADAIRGKTILGLRTRPSDPFKVVAEFRNVTVAKEFVQAVIAGIESFNATLNRNIPNETTEEEKSDAKA